MKMFLEKTKTCVRVTYGAALLVVLSILIPTATAQNLESPPPVGTRVEEGRVIIGFTETAFGRDMAVFIRGSSPSDDYRLIRWRRADNYVTLLVASRSNEADQDWIERSPVELQFPIVVCPLDESAVCIDATTMFVGGETLSGLGVSDSSFAGSKLGATTYPKNAVVSAVLDDGSKRRRWKKWNFVPLPQERMAVRIHQPTLGYTFTGFMRRARPSEPQPILRWRVDPRTDSKISVFIDPYAPERWVPWMANGILSWRVPLAFSGFDSAIEVARAGSISGWSFDDVRHSAICWGHRNGCGWKVFDPRTGEIIQFQIGGPELVAEHILPRYVVTMAGVDARVLSDTWSDDILGPLIEHVTAHEMGHVLGLRDGYFGLGTYSVDELRSIDWIVQNGISPSIMNYVRFNYALQPQDRFDQQMIIPRIGPGDIHAVRRGYGLTSEGAEDETRMLQKFLEEQSDNPSYQYSSKLLPNRSPAEVDEALGTSDPLEEAKLGVQNLELSVSLIGGKQVFPGDEYVAEWMESDQLYSAAVRQWEYMLTPVASMVGGFLRSPGEFPELFRLEIDPSKVKPISKERQQAAMRYLCSEVGAEAPRFLLEGPLLNAAGVSKEQAQQQLDQARMRIMYTTLSYRVVRLAMEADDDNYRVTDFVRDMMQECIFPGRSQVLPP